MTDYLFSIGKWLIQPVWFALPFYIPHSVALLTRKIIFLNYLVDFHLKLKNKPIFGVHKTWRGLILGILAGGLVALFQRRLLSHGLILALFSMLGDLLGSFLKRQACLAQGEKNLFFDRFLDTLFPLSAAYYFGFLYLSLFQSIYLIFISIYIHRIANILWCFLKIKEKPW